MLGYTPLTTILLLLFSKWIYELSVVLELPVSIAVTPDALPSVIGNVLDPDDLKANTKVACVPSDVGIFTPVK
jgi:hypothetical protein